MWPIKVEDERIVVMTPQDVRDMVRYISGHRARNGSFEVVIAGETPGEDHATGTQVVATYEEAGATWWIESIDPWRFGWTENEPWPAEEMRYRVRQGPPKW